MKIRLTIVLIILLYSCKGETKKYPIDQSNFSIEALPYQIDGDYKIFKFRIRHYMNKTLSIVEYRVDGMDADDKIIESGKAVEKNMQQGEERIFYVKLKTDKVAYISHKISDYE